MNGAMNLIPKVIFYFSDMGNKRYPDEVSLHMSMLP